LDAAHRRDRGPYAEHRRSFHCWLWPRASVWLELDDPNANEGMGIMACHVDASAVAGMDRNDSLAALMGQGGTIH
jgi:hypothetical protein